MARASSTYLFTERDLTARRQAGRAGRTAYSCGSQEGPVAGHRCSPERFRPRRTVARGRSSKDRGLGGLRAPGSEALQLVIDYVKQETLDPLKGLGRYILFGVAGSVALAIGLVVLSVGFLRLLQGETGTDLHRQLVLGPLRHLRGGGGGGGGRRRLGGSRGQGRPPEPEKETMSPATDTDHPRPTSRPSSAR